MKLFADVETAPQAMSDRALMEDASMQVDRLAVLAQEQAIPAGESERVAHVRGSFGAEGATAPETLRPTDRRGYWNAGK